MVVEDDPGARDPIASAIIELPDRVLTHAVASLADARTAMEQQWPDVLLVDLGLPDGDGSELIREISASK